MYQVLQQVTHFYSPDGTCAYQSTEPFALWYVRGNDRAHVEGMDTLYLSRTGLSEEEALALLKEVAASLDPKIPPTPRYPYRFVLRLPCGTTDRYFYAGGFGSRENALRALYVVQSHLPEGSVRMEEG